MTRPTIRRYSELKHLKTFQERYEYLKLSGVVGEDTFGFDRYLNQDFYKSAEWKHLRREVIIRDNGCDLGIDGYEIHGKILIHHMNPIGPKDILDRSEFLMNPDFLITVTLQTHNAIHYGDTRHLASGPIERAKNDTCPWRN